MSHRARRQLAPSPDDAVARVAAEVGRAFEAWASRFVDLVVRDVVRPSRRDDQADLVSGAQLIKSLLHEDATVRQLFEEAGRVEPRREVLESAFKMVDKQSADELRVAGVRTADVVPGLPTKQAEWLRSNTDLIKAESDLRRRVERVIADPLNEGRSVKDIAKLLQEQLGYSKSRAELTARDQTLKLYGQIQQERQEKAGITKYVWTTSQDERVRPDHADLDGTVQAWDDPPVVDKRTGRRGHPGFDYQCRCTAVPVLDDEVETGGAPPPPEPVMQATQAELDLARRQAESEARRARLEAEADARIARARAKAERQAREQAAADARARAEAERQAAEARAAAERRRATARPAAQVVEDFKRTAPAANLHDVAPFDTQVREVLFRDSDTLYERLPEESAGALREFVGPYYPAIRAIQQGLSDAEILEFVPFKIDKIRELRAKMPALAQAQRGMRIERPTEIGPLYRGIAVDENQLAKWLNGSEVEFKAFSNSASFELETAQDFAGGAVAEGSTAERPLSKIILKIDQVDEGALAMFADNENALEAEVILGKTSFRVAGKSYDKLTDTYVLDLVQATPTKLDAVPQPDQPRDFNRFVSNGLDCDVR
jgi:SPP1 gp7 family putative phage head morphogenesis protein